MENSRSSKPIFKKKKVITNILDNFSNENIRQPIEESLPSSIVL